MIATILLFSDDPRFSERWRPAFEELGCDVRATSPENLPVALERGGAAVFDLGAEGFDEDEVLTAVGFAASQGAVVAADMADNEDAADLEEVLDEICGGLVLRRAEDRGWAAPLMVRRLDRRRASRFEYVTISPKGDAVLAILADGHASILPRPLTTEDDGSEIQAITLSDDATTATLELSSTMVLTLTTSDVAKRNGSLGHFDPVGFNGGMERSALGARLKKLRLSSGLTQAELARRTGIHRPNIARVEAGRHTPSLETIARIATAIGVPATEILRE